MLSELEEVRVRAEGSDSLGCRGSRAPRIEYHRGIDHTVDSTVRRMGT